MIAPVISGLKASMRDAPTPVTVASRLPMAPLMVSVDVAASTAASSKPSDMMAWLNSSAVISPLVSASEKSPVYAPASCKAFWMIPDAPGMASRSWFQFSVVSLPAPAVWVMTCETVEKVSELPPATALRLPAACVSRSACAAASVDDMPNDMKLDASAAVVLRTSPRSYTVSSAYFWVDCVSASMSEVSKPANSSELANCCAESEALAISPARSLT